MANDFSAVTKQLIEDGKLRKKEFDEERELLKGMAEALESAGLKAEDNAEYAKRANKLTEQELKFRKKITHNVLKTLRLLLPEKK